MRFVIHIPSTNQRIEVGGTDRASVFQVAKDRQLFSRVFRVLEYDSDCITAMDNYQWDPSEGRFADPFSY